MQKLNHMRITLLSYDILLNNREQNLKLLSSEIKTICNSKYPPNLILLPEFFTTGFPASRTLAEPLNGETLNWMTRLSKECGCALIGSFPVVDKELYYNKALFVSPSGIEGCYNKRHLFSYADEDKEYKAGQERVIVNYMGFSIMLNICYDLRFPVWSRNIDNQYDLLINIANWPSTRSQVIEPLIRARAIENLSYAAFLNRSGSDLNSNYNGERLLFNYLGESISPVDYGKNFSTFELLLEPLFNYRERFRAWNDADSFKILI